MLPYSRTHIRIQQVDMYMSTQGWVAFGNPLVVAELRSGPLEDIHAIGGDKEDDVFVRVLVTYHDVRSVLERQQPAK